MTVLMRRGRKVPNTLYRQVGEEPSDGDVFLGSFVDPEDAEDVVLRVNDYDRLALTVQRLQQRVDTAERESAHFRELAAAATQEPVMTAEQRTDVEAAFQRGVEHARTQQGGGYANREILLKLAPVLSRLDAGMSELTGLVDWLAEGPTEPVPDAVMSHAEFTEQRDAAIAQAKATGRAL